jgi:hypothetical protein
LALGLALAVSQATAPVAFAVAPHLVDGQQMSARLAQDAAERAERVKLVQDVLDSQAAQKQAGVMGLNVGKLRAAVPQLSNAELSDLSSRAQNTKDLAAGYHDDGLVIVGVVLLLVGLAVLVAVGGDYGYYDDCGCY